MSGIHIKLQHHHVVEWPRIQPTRAEKRREAWKWAVSTLFDKIVTWYKVPPVKISATAATTPVAALLSKTTRAPLVAEAVRTKCHLPSIAEETHCDLNSFIAIPRRLNFPAMC